VWNKRDPNVPKDAVYIGRPSIWGNPFHIDNNDPTKTRELAVEAHKKWLFNGPNPVLNKIPQLKGKDLVCYCAPLACHGDILLEIANKEQDG
jgi:hypothetical protein